MMKIIKHLRMKKDFFFLLTISCIFFLLIMSDATSWYYSAIGDEYAFFSFAQKIITGETPVTVFHHPGTLNFFSQKGVYDVVPVAGSAYQAAVMTIVGMDHAGWIISSVLAVILSLWFFYFLVKDRYGQHVAVFATIFFISSHYLWAFTHLGYWNIHVLTLPLAAFFFFQRGVLKKSWYHLLLAGILTGLGFYTYFTARITLPLLLLWSIYELRFFKQQKLLFIFFCVGIAITLTPYVAVNQEAVISQMIDRSAVGSTELQGHNRFFLGIANTANSFLGFFKNTQTSHFVSGSLVDPLTGIFLAGGLALFFLSWRKHSFFLLSFLISLIGIAGFSPYLYTPITRLFFLLPFIACLAGYSLAQLTRYTKKKCPHISTSVVPLIILSFVFLLNLYRFYISTPKRIDLTPESLALKQLQTFPLCKVSPVLISPFANSLLAPALSTHSLSQSVLLLESITQLHSDEISRKNCFIFLDKSEDEFSYLLREYDQEKNLVRKTVYSPSKTTTIEVFYRKE